MNEIIQYEQRSIIYNDNFHSDMSNKLIKGFQNLTLDEARFTRLVIAQISMNDKKVFSYSTTVTELANFFGLEKSTRGLKSRIKTISTKLQSKVILIENTDTGAFDAINWFKRISYDGKESIVFFLHEDLIPYISNLQSFWTPIRLKYTKEFSSLYAFRLYELLESERRINKYVKELNFTVKYLREFMLATRDEFRQAIDGNKIVQKIKYPEFSNFRDKVIDQPLKEINTITNLNISYEYFPKKGTTNIIFIIDTKNNVDNVDNDIDDISAHEVSEYDYLKQQSEVLHKLSDKQIKQLLEITNNDTTVLLDKCQLAQEQSNIKSLFGWLKKAILDNYSTITYKAQQKTSNASTNQFNNFPQREYSKEDYAQLEIDLMNLNYFNEDTKNNKEAKTI